MSDIRDGQKGSYREDEPGRKLEVFREWQERLAAYRMALSLIGVDANADAPSEGAAYRAGKKGILVGEYRKLMKDDEMYALTEELYRLSQKAGNQQLADPDISRELELAYRQLKKDRSVPVEEYVEFESVLDRSRRAWPKAKKEADFTGFAPALQAVIDSYRRIVRLQAEDFERQEICGRTPVAGSLYDLMLDDHQPGWDTAKYDRFFSGVREHIIPLLSEIRKKDPPQDSFLHLCYPAEGQRRVMKKVTEYLGVSASWGKLTESEHPLTTCICRGDIRLTTKYRVQDPSLAILSTVHESGHAWYGHNIAEKYEGSMAARTISAGLHESQSRLCENHLGRSFPFWKTVFPWLQEEFPEQLSGVDAKTFFRAVNTVKPSPIRTEADEVTYPLHILIRYELEKEMMEGRLTAAELEEAWNEKYRKYLGITPANASEGILQDMHWPYAYFGYFPTYALGSAIAAQIFCCMEREMDVEKLLLENRYPELMHWLKDHVQYDGNRHPAEYVIRRACGEDFDASYYFRYLEGKYLS